MQQQAVSRKKSPRARERQRPARGLACALGTLALCVAQSACTGDREYVRIKIEPDAAMPDGSITRDGSVATLPDGAPLPDGSFALVDGGLEDAGRDPNQLDPTVSCEVAVQDEGFDHVVGFGSESGFTLTIAETGFGLALRSMGSCNGALATMPISALGSFSTPNTITSECLTLTDVALVRSNDRFRIAWADNFTGSTELHSMLLDNALMPSS